MCCDSWGLKESDTTERLNWTELIISIGRTGYIIYKAQYKNVGPIVK